MLRQCCSVWHNLEAQLPILSKGSVHIFSYKIIIICFICYWSQWCSRGFNERKNAHLPFKLSCNIWFLMICNSWICTTCNPNLKVWHCRLQLGRVRLPSRASFLTSSPPPLHLLSTSSPPTPLSRLQCCGRSLGNPHQLLRPFFFTCQVALQCCLVHLECVASQDGGDNLLHRINLDIKSAEV